MDTLPIETLGKIFGYLSFSEAVRLETLSRKCAAAVQYELSRFKKPNVQMNVTFCWCNALFKIHTSSPKLLRESFTFTENGDAVRTFPEVVADERRPKKTIRAIRRIGKVLKMRKTVANHKPYSNLSEALEWIRWNSAALQEKWKLFRPNFTSGNIQSLEIACTFFFDFERPSQGRLVQTFINALQERDIHIETLILRLDDDMLGFNEMQMIKLAAKLGQQNIARRIHVFCTRILLDHCNFMIPIAQEFSDCEIFLVIVPEKINEIIEALQLAWFKLRQQDSSTTSHKAWRLRINFEFVHHKYMQRRSKVEIDSSELQTAEEDDDPNFQIEVKEQTDLTKLCVALTGT